MGNHRWACEFLCCLLVSFFGVAKLDKAQEDLTTARSWTWFVCGLEVALLWGDTKEAALSNRGTYCAGLGHHHSHGWSAWVLGPGWEDQLPQSRLVSFLLLCHVVHHQEVLDTRMLPSCCSKLLGTRTMSQTNHFTLWSTWSQIFCYSNTKWSSTVIHLEETLRFTWGTQDIVDNLITKLSKPNTVISLLHWPALYIAPSLK